MGKKQLKIDRTWPSFDDVRGYETETKRLKSVAQALRDTRNFDVFPKGIMFSGQPGTGKTTMAKAFIRATEFPCFVPDSLPTAASLSKVYSEAIKKTPSIVFLDDVDRILTSEGSDGFASDESRSCLKELLARLDGLECSDGVITVMTTNEYYNLDEAVKRSGRVDLHIPIDRPNDEDRAAILRFYMNQHKDFFPDDKELVESVAQKTHGMTCADLKLIVKDVYLLNYSSYGTKNVPGTVISVSRIPDFADAFQSRIMEINSGGLLKKTCKNDEDMRRICYHESAHALVDWVMNGKASDICSLQTADSGRGGWTAPRQSDEESKFFCYNECMGEIAACLAGLAAESIFMDSVSLGAGSDIDQAMAYARYMMAGGLVKAYEPKAAKDGEFFFLPAILPNRSLYVGDDVQTEEYIGNVQRMEHELLTYGYFYARSVIREFKDAIEGLASQLQKRGVLSAERVTGILDSFKVPKKAFFKSSGEGEGGEPKKEENNDN